MNQYGDLSKVFQIKTGGNDNPHLSKYMLGLNG